MNEAQDETTEGSVVEPWSGNVDSGTEETPSVSWTHQQIDDWAEARGLSVEGTKSDKLEMIEATVDAPQLGGEPSPAAASDVPPEPGDSWAEPGTPIPNGAKGPTVAALRRSIMLEDGGDKFDRTMKARVEYVQRLTGLPVTGRIDVATRKYLDTLP